MNTERINPTEPLFTEGPAKPTISERIIHNWIENITTGTTIEYPQDFGFEFQQVISEGAFPIIIANHRSLYGALPLAEVASDLTRAANVVSQNGDKSKGYLLPLATSVANGGKVKDIQSYYKASKSLLMQRHVAPVLLARKKDVSNGDSWNFREFSSNMLQEIANGYKGIVLFPEGTVDSGRRKTIFSKRNGMQPLQEGAIATMAEIAGARKGKEIAIIPVGIIGDETVLDPALKINMPHVLPLIAGLTGVGCDRIVKVKVGELIRSTNPEISEYFQNIKQTTSRTEIDNYFGNKIAELLPEHMRGVYKVQ